jgi:hypothetical protein
VKQLTRIRIHWASGSAPTDFVLELGDDPEAVVNDVTVLKPKPAWVRLDDLFLHTQAISAIEVVSHYTED